MQFLVFEYGVRPIQLFSKNAFVLELGYSGGNEEKKLQIGILAKDLFGSNTGVRHKLD